MVKAICAHCKTPTESKDLQLITQKGVSFYGCKTCANLYRILDNQTQDEDTLNNIDKASGNDIPG
jgi:protein-arginine kinase activator protein McsA